MAEQLAGELKITLTPPGGSAEVSKLYRYASESFANTLRRQFSVPLNTTNFLIALPFTTVSFLMMTSDGPFNYKLQSTGDTTKTCRRVAIHTPNAEVLTNVYITTGAAPVIIDVIAAGT